jgi:flagella basal body P-ring formation protein FlgA
MLLMPSGLSQVKQSLDLRDAVPAGSRIGLGPIPAQGRQSAGILAPVMQTLIYWRLFRLRACGDGFTRLVFGLLLLLLLPALASAFTTADAIRATATACLRAPPGVSDFKAGAASLDARLRLPDCSTALACDAPTGAFKATQTVAVYCTAPAFRVHVPLTVQAWVEAVVVTRPLARGVAIGAADVRLERRELAQLPYGYMTDPGQALGQLTARALAAGHALLPRQLRAGALVRRGDTITLLARRGGMAVRMQGEALGEGAAGTRVRVRNARSQRVVEGTVVAAGLVELGL